MKLEHLGVCFTIRTNWAEITLKPASSKIVVQGNTGLTEIEAEGWKIASATHIGEDRQGNQMVYLLFERKAGQ